MTKKLLRLVYAASENKNFCRIVSICPTFLYGVGKALSFLISFLRFSHSDSFLQLSEKEEEEEEEEASCCLFAV
jgi:hypothetical protein